MSGGYWDYKNDSLAYEIFRRLSPDYGERGFKQASLAKKINPLEDKMMSEMLWDMFCVLHSYDWYVCGDTGDETYRKDVARFKKKWLKVTEKELENADVAPVVHNWWEQIGEADYRCPVCGFRFTTCDPIEMFAYCRCGAKMDGERKDGSE